LPNNYNDIDLCLKLLERGQRIVYTPYVQLRHHESVSKTTEAKALASVKQESRNFMKIWRHKFPRDPYYSIHLSQELPYYHVGASSLRS
jgi:GT2 family glycosyltransferase